MTKTSRGGRPGLRRVSTYILRPDRTEGLRKLIPTLTLLDERFEYSEELPSKMFQINRTNPIAEH
jgi:hypothetical protein